jgi:hypothetical protein
MNLIEAPVLEYKKLTEAAYRFNQISQKHYIRAKLPAKGLEDLAIRIV